MSPTAHPDAGSDSLPWSGEKVRTFRAAILEFFRERSRDLPWRETSDPYRILVSEVMLQQTRVETVVPYYRRWMERFPDPGSLAAADLDEVLGIWEGLGYYGRARNLHRAVREVVTRYDGEVPSEPDELRRLPGVGPYTAGAVASMAFGEAVPAVDGNVRRVLARLLDAPSPTAGELEEWARALVDPERPGDFNQALMELGSLECTPRSPGCERCPVAGHCAARAAGTQGERPAPRPRKPPPRVDEAVAVLVRSGSDGDEVLLRKRPEKGLLGGMWELPGVRAERGRRPREAAVRLARELLAVSGGREVGEAEAEEGPGGGGPGRPRKLPPVSHAFSHRRMRYHPFLFRVKGRSPEEAGPPLRWAPPGSLGDHALPVAQRRILRSVVKETAT